MRGARSPPLNSCQGRSWSRFWASYQRKHLYLVEDPQRESLAYFQPTPKEAGCCLPAVCRGANGTLLQQKCARNICTHARFWCPNLLSTIQIRPYISPAAGWVGLRPKTPFAPLKGCFNMTLSALPDCPWPEPALGSTRCLWIRGCDISLQGASATEQ